MIAAVSAVSAMSAVFRHSSANGEGDGENDRKEGFHGTKAFVAAHSRGFSPTKGGRSDSRVVGAGRVEQKRRRANGRVLDSLARSLVSNVEKKRPGTESGVKAAIGVAEERKPPNRCVSYAGSEAFKGISPFRRVEAWIAAVRRRVYGFRCR